MKKPSKELIIIIAIVSISVAIFANGLLLHVSNINHDSSSLELKLMNKTNVIMINQIVTSLKPDHESNMTSIVSNTEQTVNSTVLHLVNGVTLQTNQDIKSGDIVSLNSEYFKPVCSLSLSSINNTTIQNNTIVLMQIHKDPRCQDGFLLVQINEWHKLNQK